MLVYISLLFPVLAPAPPVNAQDFIPQQVVFPITDFKPDLKNVQLMSMKFGTGFCLDPDCRFVGTNYHVAKVMGSHIRVKGVASLHCFLDSDPEDAGALAITLGGGRSLTYTPAHDLAIYEMQHPLKHFHGMGFDAHDLEDSIDVDIYGYPLNSNPKRSLAHWHGKFVGANPQGLLTFSYEDGTIRHGTSGGIVVNSKTKKIIGIFNALAGSNDRIAFAVPTKELADFVTRAQPYLRAIIFPKAVSVSPTASDLYRPYIWSRSDELLSRPVEPSEVINLRRAAQHLADSMRDFIATETFSWGHDDQEPEATDSYETLLVDGFERWRHVGSDKFIHHAPIPLISVWVTPGSEWVDLPKRVGTQLDLKIHLAPDAVVGEQHIHVFQYQGKIEDGVCGIQHYVLPMLWSKERTYDCHGEVWTDESGSILRISETYDPTGNALYRGVMTYRRLNKEGKQHSVPNTIIAEYGNNWCRAMFSDYGVFEVKTNLVLTTDTTRASAAPPLMR